MNFIGHFSFYRNVLQNTQKNEKKGKKRQLNWFIASVMRDIIWKISWKVTWIGMNEYELACPMIGISPAHIWVMMDFHYW